MFLGILTMITALCISAVAIYYSVAGLMAIFAAAAIPIMIMGGVLEVSKLVTAVWLHYYWQEATWWLKTYLTTAVIVLMFITSMGIFGFLSRAHIEQTATATEGLAQIERLDADIARQQAGIQRANERIESIQTQDSGRDQEIQAQIDREQSRIDSAYERIQPAIDEQNAIVEQEQQKAQERIDLLDTDIERIDQELESLRAALANEDVELAQGIVGVRVDGTLGPNTEAAIERFRNQRQSEKQRLVQQIESIRQTPNSVIDNARNEIQRLRSLAEKQISDSNNLINRLRDQLGQTDRAEIEQRVSEQRTKINEANNLIDQYTEQKYQLEAEYRKLEAEVGPVKYLAEFMYGETADKDLLEESVRWVIVIIIFVFDPLAVLLLIASQYTFELNAKKKKVKQKTIEKTHSEVVSDLKLEQRKAEQEYTEKFIENSQFDKESYAREHVENQKQKEQERKHDYEQKDATPEWGSAKKKWKAEHPEETLKVYKQAYIQGKIDQLPWEKYIDNNEQN